MRALRSIHRWRWARRTTAVVFFALLLLGRFDRLDWLEGSMTTTTAFGVVPFTDPLAALEVTLATRSWHGTMLIGEALLVGMAAVLGPVFCGWLCPLGLLLDLNWAIRRRLPGWPKHRPDDRGEPARPSGIRYAVLGVVLGFAPIGRVPAFQILSPINILAWGVIFSPGFELLVIGGIMAVEMISPRLWCRVLCPSGALYAAIGRRAILRVRIAAPDACSNKCRLCDPACSLGIRVTDQYVQAGKDIVDHPDCTRCGDCIDACPGHVVRLGFRSDQPRSQVEGDR